MYHTKLLELVSYLLDPEYISVEGMKSSGIEKSNIRQQHKKNCIIVLITLLRVHKNKINHICE